jgi:hypothetical protein
MHICIGFWPALNLQLGHDLASGDTFLVPVYSVSMLSKISNTGYEKTPFNFVYCLLLVSSLAAEICMVSS